MPHESASSAPIEVRLLREVAAGPSTTVFLGDIPSERHRRVAVKLLRELPDGGVDRLLDLRDRARCVGDLAHRHLVTATGVARVDARFAFIMPWIDGIDLLDWVDVLAETQAVIPRRVTCEIIRATSVALEASWRAPGPEGKPIALPHRDLKPSNLMVTRDGELKLTDFATGYSAVAGRAAKTGVLKKGLVRYFAPERREGHRGGRTADVYALGILALELLRGKWLRRPHSLNPAHDRQMSDVVANLADLQMRSDSDDRALRNLLLRMVAFEPDARPSMDEVTATFRGLADRAEGPSLETFAIQHAVPWLENPVSEPDERLQGVVATLLERGADLPAPNTVSFSMVGLPDRYDVQLEGGGSTGEYEVVESEDARREEEAVTRPIRRPAGFLDDDPEPAPTPIPPTAPRPAPPRLPSVRADLPPETSFPANAPPPTADDTLDGLPPPDATDVELTLDQTLPRGQAETSAWPWGVIVAVGAVCFVAGAGVSVVIAAAVGLVLAR